tara:strand:- start:82 stop:753 length:672 start_codon:yes stop_codon:yes gene_type:complete
MSNRLIEFAGQKIELHHSGALFWHQQGMLVVGDLHLEKASSYHKSGQILPPYDTAETLRRLSVAMSLFAPKRILLLGDVFHDGAAWQRMASSDRDHLLTLLDRIDTFWIKGNHDEHFVPPGYISQTSFKFGGITFRHIMDMTAKSPEISAHYHPVALIRHRGARVRRACFVCTPQRLLMPAFGALTGGLDVSNAALASLRGPDTQIYLLGNEAVFLGPPGLAR